MAATSDKKSNLKKKRPKTFKKKKTTASQRRHKKAFKKCQKIWPTIFKITGVKPLAINIRDELLKDAESRGVEISNGTIYNAIYWISRTFQYQRSLSVCSHRVDIHGNDVETILPRHKETARNKCSEMSKKRNDKRAQKKPKNSRNSKGKSTVVIKKKRKVSTSK